MSLDCSEKKTIDLTFTKRGKFNVVVFWYEMILIDDVKILIKFGGEDCFFLMCVVV